MSDFKDLTNEMKKTNQKVDKLSKSVEESTAQNAQNNVKLTQGVGEIIKNDVGGGIKDLAGTITGPLTSFAKSIPGLSTMGSVAKAIAGNVVEKSKQIEIDREKTRRDNKSNTLLEGIGNSILDLKDSMLKGLATTTGLGLGAIAGLIAAPVITLVSFFKTLSVEFKFLTTLTKNLVGGKFFAPLRFAFNFIMGGFQQLFNLAKFGLSVALAPARMFFGYFPQIGAAFNGLLGFITTVVKGAKFGEFFAFIGGRLMAAVRFVKGIFTPVITWFKTLTTVSGAASGMFSGIAKFAAGFGTVLGKIFLPITILMSAFDFITGFMSGYKEDGILGGLEGGLTKLFGNLIGMPLDLLKSAVGWIAGVFGFDGVKSALESFSFKDLIGDMISGIFDGVDGIFTFLKDLFDFSDLSIFGVFQKLIDIVFLPLNLAINFVKGIFGFGDEEEPFSLGGFIGETVTAVINWFKTLFSDPVAALGQLWDTITGGYDSLFSLISWPIDAAINWIMGLFGWSDPDGEPFSLWGTIKSALSSVWEWLAGLFTFDLGDAVKDLLPSWTPGWVKKALGLGGGGDDEESSDPRMENSQRREELEREIAAAEDRIARSQAGENVYFGRESVGQADDQELIDQMKAEIRSQIDPNKIHFARLSDGNFHYFKMSPDGNRIEVMDDQQRAAQMYDAQQNLQDSQAEGGTAPIIVKGGDTYNSQSGGGGGYVPVSTSDRDSQAWNGTND